MRDIHPVEMLVVVALALVWSLITVIRLIVVPVVAIITALVTTPRRSRTPGPAGERSRPDVPPQPADLAVVRDQLMQQTAAELRRLTGSRRRCAKRDLVAAYLALPI